MKSKAFNNKEYIGTEYEEIIFIENELTGYVHGENITYGKYRSIRRWGADIENMLQRATNFRGRKIR